MLTTRHSSLTGLLLTLAVAFVACSSSTDDPAGPRDGQAGQSGGGSSNNAGSGGSSNNAGSGGSSNNAGSGGTGTGGEGGSGASSTGGSGADPFASARKRCVELTNEYRDKVGAPHLTRVNAKESCVDSQCKSDSAGGSAHGAFGKCDEMAQNECPGWPGTNPEESLTKCLADMFAEGPGSPYSEHGHYINMTSTKYTGLACGFYKTSDGKLWIIQDFYP